MLYINEIFINYENNYFTTSEFAFDELKEFWFPLEFKMYKGIGIYNSECEFLGNEFTDAEEGIKYTLSDSGETIGNVHFSYKIKIIHNLKFICKSQNFN